MNRQKPEHPKDFPSVPLDNVKNLPSAAGIYFAVKDGEVLYVGQSENMRERWSKHHKYSDLKRIGCVRIHFALSDGRPLVEQENEWIVSINPVGNGGKFLYVPKQPPYLVLSAPLFFAFVISFVGREYFRSGLLEQSWDKIFVGLASFGICLLVASFLVGVLASWFFARREWKRR